MLSQLRTFRRSSAAGHFRVGHFRVGLVQQIERCYERGLPPNAASRNHQPTYNPDHRAEEAALRSAAALEKVLRRRVITRRYTPTNVSGHIFWQLSGEGPLTRHRRKKRPSLCVVRQRIHKSWIIGKSASKIKKNPNCKLL